MNVATISRKTKKAYLRQCPEKLKKKSGSKGLKKIKIHKFVLLCTA